MNRELEALIRIEDLLDRLYETDVINDSHLHDTNIISVALERLEELEKAFDSLSKDDEKTKKLLSLEIEKNKKLQIIEEKFDIEFYEMKDLDEKVEYIEATYDEYNYGEDDYATETLMPETLYDKTCVSREQMFNYLGFKGGYAISISNLEIFDKPKELNEFATTKQQLVYIEQIQPIFQNISLTRAPQSRQYIEVEE